MKLKLIPHSRLLSTRREIPAGPSFMPSGGSTAQKRERLYDAIRQTYAFMHKREDPEGFMETVRRRYPAPTYFLESGRQALERAGLSRLDAFYYAMIPHLTRTVLSQRWGDRPKLDTLALFREYVGSLYVGIHVECFYAIMLDRQGRLIRPVLLQKGDVDNTPFYIGQLLTVTLRENARFLALVHNHPGGTKRPSREDLRCTLRALNAFASLGIPLLDHVIVAGNSVVSIREAGLLPAMLWTATQPGSRIVTRWLDGNLNNS